MSKKAIDPRDLQLGRSNVKDNKELIDFYSKLEAKSTTAFWKRANDIEPWEPAGSQGSMSLARFQKAVVDFASSLL